MTVLENIYVERGAGSTPPSALMASAQAVAGPGEQQRCHGGDAPRAINSKGGLMAMPNVEGATAGGPLWYNTGSSGALLPISPQLASSLRFGHHPISSEARNRVTETTYATEEESDLSMDITHVRSQRDGRAPNDAPGRQTLSKDMALRHTLPRNAALVDRRSSPAPSESSGFIAAGARGFEERTATSRGALAERTTLGMSGGDLPHVPDLYATLGRDGGSMARSNMRETPPGQPRAFHTGAHKAIPGETAQGAGRRTNASMQGPTLRLRRPDSFPGGTRSAISERATGSPANGTVSLSQLYRSFDSPSERSSAPSVGATIRGSRDEWRTTPSLSMPPLRETSPVLPSADSYGPNTLEAFHLEQEQQQSHRHRYQAHGSGEELMRSGRPGVPSAGEYRGDADGGMTSVPGERRRSPLAGEGDSFIPRRLGASTFDAVHDSALVSSRGDARDRSRGSDRMYRCESQPSFVPPLHSRSRSDCRWDRQRVVPSRRPSWPGALREFSRGHPAAPDLFDGPHPPRTRGSLLHRQWGVSDLASHGDDRNSSRLRYHSTTLPTRTALPHETPAAESTVLSAGRGYVMTRHRRLQEQQQQQQQPQMDQETAYPSQRRVMDTFGSICTPSEDGVDAASMLRASSISPPDPRTESAVSRMERLVIAEEAHSWPGTPLHASCDMKEVLGSPESPQKLPTPKSPLEWLRNLSLRQARGSNKDKSATAQRPPKSPTASPVSIVGLPGGDDSRITHQLTASTFLGEEMCPAPDCPGSGDCLPDATPDMLVFEVKFKRLTRTFMPSDVLGENGITCGDHVKVEADRGEDLGTVHRSLPLEEYLNALFEEKRAKAAKIAENGGGGGDGSTSERKKKKNKSKKQDDDAGKAAARLKQQQQKRREEEQETKCPVRAIKRIISPATAEELEQLEDKAQDEAQVVRVCQTRVRNRGLPMKIVDAEYQFDRNKLTLFFEAEKRIDFRELVRDLFAVYKTRIWMQQVKDKSGSSSGRPGDSPTDSFLKDDGSDGVDTSTVSASTASLCTEATVATVAGAAAFSSSHETDHDSGYGSCGSNDSGGHNFGEAVGAGGVGSAPSMLGNGCGKFHGCSGSFEPEKSSDSASAVWQVEFEGSATIMHHATLDGYDPAC